MGTIKPIGTISYNTPDYLMHVLYDLYNDNWIDDYRAIFHYGEGVSEITGLPKKDHFHVWLSPARKLDLVLLKDRFNEPDPNNEEPLECKPFRYSEPLNWLLYVLHDPDYLRAHGSTTGGDGKLLYFPIDIVAGHRELLDIDYDRACHIRLNSNQIVMEEALKGKGFIRILSEHPEVNPVNLRSILAGMHEDVRASALRPDEPRGPEPDCQ